MRDNTGTDNLVCSLNATFLDAGSITTTPLASVKTSGMAGWTSSGTASISSGLVDNFSKTLFINVEPEFGNWDTSDDNLQISLVIIWYQTSDIR